MLGPIDYVVVAFPGNNFNGNILPEIDKLEASGTIRVVDVIFIHKDENGSVEALETSEMPADVADKITVARSQLKDLLSETDVEHAADLLDNNSSAGILVFENLWAVELKKAVVESGGVLVASGRVTDEDVAEAEAQLSEGEEE